MQTEYTTGDVVRMRTKMWCVSRFPLALELDSSATARACCVTSFLESLVALALPNTAYVPSVVSNKCTIL